MIEVKIEGVERTARSYERLLVELQPPGVQVFLNHLVDPFLQERIDRRFANEGDDAVGKWIRLAVTTGMIRARKGFPPFNPINKRTGELHRFVRDTRTTRATASGATLTKPKIGGARELQTKLRHAQQGGVSYAGPFPARPVVALNRQDQVGIERRFERWIDALIQRSFS